MKTVTKHSFHRYRYRDQLLDQISSSRATFYLPIQAIRVLRYAGCRPGSRRSYGRLSERDAGAEGKCTRDRAGRATDARQFDGARRGDNLTGHKGERTTARRDYKPNTTQRYSVTGYTSRRLCAYRTLSITLTVR